jgi:hypothetical protein
MASLNETSRDVDASQEPAVAAACGRAGRSHVVSVLRVHPFGARPWFRRFRRLTSFR